MVDESTDFPLLDPLETERMLKHTKEQIRHHIQVSLNDVCCEVHSQPPSVKVIGMYSRESEQMDLSYHVDTCCKSFLLQVVARLNRG